MKNSERNAGKLIRKINTCRDKTKMFFPREMYIIVNNIMYTIQTDNKRVHVFKNIGKNSALLFQRIGGPQQLTASRGLYKK